MLRKLFAAIGLATATTAQASPPYSPYSSEAANAIYNLLFCDNSADFLSKAGEASTPWQRALASSPPDLQALRALANDGSQEGRIRYLAFQRLRAAGQSVPPKQLLGVIVEVPLAGGLDTLAAYSDGGVRYVNQSGKLAIVEGAESISPMVTALLSASQPVVNAIGPWTEVRRPPPVPGNVRLTFLVSDGLYFGEGPMTVMQGEQSAAPIIARATELQRSVVAANTN